MSVKNGVSYRPQNPGGGGGFRRGEGEGRRGVIEEEKGISHSMTTNMKGERAFFVAFYCVSEVNKMIYITAKMSKC